MYEKLYQLLLSSDEANFELATQLIYGGTVSKRKLCQDADRLFLEGTPKSVELAIAISEVLDYNGFFRNKEVWDNRWQITEVVKDYEFSSKWQARYSHFMEKMRVRFLFFIGEPDPAGEFFFLMQYLVHEEAPDLDFVATLIEENDGSFRIKNGRYDYYQGSECSSERIEEELETSVIDNEYVQEVLRGLWSIRYKIKHLLISGHRVDKFPTIINEFPNLVSLSLVNTQINKLDLSSKKVKQLTGLYLSDTPFETIPSEVLEMTSLTSFQFSGNRGILTKIPQELVQLTHLQRLFLGRNQINLNKEAVKSLAKFPTLKYLSLQENSLRLLPANISKLSFLEKLDLGYNTLDIVSPYFAAETTNETLPGHQQYAVILRKLLPNTKTEVFYIPSDKQ